MDYVHKSEDKDVESEHNEEMLKFYCDYSYILIVKHEKCLFLIIFTCRFRQDHSKIKRKYAIKCSYFFHECLMSIWMDTTYLCERRCELAFNDTILVSLSISSNLPDIHAILTASRPPGVKGIMWSYMINATFEWKLCTKQDYILFPGKDLSTEPFFP